jgi:hypothetical protein
MQIPVAMSLDLTSVTPSSPDPDAACARTLAPSSSALAPAAASSSADSAVSAPVSPLFSLSSFVQLLESVSSPSGGPLSSAQVPLVRAFVLELGQRWSDLNFSSSLLALKMEVLPGVMDRIVLYHDPARNLELRVHLFRAIEETYVHNHGPRVHQHVPAGGLLAQTVGRRRRR